jgi:hypothetical protein
MVRTTEFENILNDCLDRLIQGKTIASCLKSYPHYAAELEPLLKTARETLVAASIKPRPEFRQRAANEFQAAIRNIPVKKQGRAFRWQLRLVLPVAIVLILLSAGSGTVVAATNALPDSPLYSIKMATESVQLSFTFSDEGKAELYSKFVDYRVEEIVSMVKNGDLSWVGTTTDRMNVQLLEITKLGLRGNRSNVMGSDWGFMNSAETQTTIPYNADWSGNITKTDNGLPPLSIAPATAAEVTDTDILIQHLLEEMENNIRILQEQMENAPPAVQAALQNAIDVIQAGYSQIIDSLQ